MRVPVSNLVIQGNLTPEEELTLAVIIAAATRLGVRAGRIGTAIEEACDLAGKRSYRQMCDDIRESMGS